jgi:hypothetical protein
MMPPGLPANTNTLPPRRLPRFRHSIRSLIILSTASSFVLASYVLAVSNFLLIHRGADVVGDAALYAARALADTHVDSTAFGIVGICDQTPEESGAINLRSRSAQSVRGINSVYGSLRIDALIAAKLKNPTITQLLHQDFSRAREVETALAFQMKQAVAKSAVSQEEPGDFFGVGSRFFGHGFTKPATKVSNYLYQDTYHYLSRAARHSNSTLVDLNITLGFLRWSFAQTAVKAPDKSEVTIADDAGFYKAGVPISMPNLAPIMFTTSPQKTKLVSPAAFIADDRPGAPSAILVEAVFKENKKDERHEATVIKKSACAVIGNPVLKYSPSALVLNFPQGLPKQFQSAQFILEQASWSAPGNWREASRGDVPGAGTLARPTTLKLSEMAPNQAFAIALYGWLKTLPTNSDASKCLHLLSFNWQSLFAGKAPKTGASVQKDSTAPSVVNSCLVQDTDSRTFAFMNQGAPGGAGQAAIANVFAASQTGPGVIFNGAPPSALPLIVDADGVCNLAGCRGFDQDLIDNFFEQVHETNLAALESLSVAKQLRTKFQEERAQLQPKFVIEKQEWNSILGRINREKKVKTETQDAPGQKWQAEGLQPDELLREKLAALRKALGDDEKELARLNRGIVLASTAIANATHAIDFTYQITANAFSVCREGIVPLDSNMSRFLISKKLIFAPHNKPLSEFDFDEAPKGETKRAGLLTNFDSSDWLKDGSPISMDIDDLLKRKDRDASILEAKLRVILPVPSAKSAVSPTLIVFDSQMMVARGLPQPMLFNSYPFSNIFIPSGQLIYYCQDALRTGAKPEVTWSVLVRDLAASWLEGNAGEPVASSDQDWCKQKGQAVGACPGLITEFQLRSPLPVLKGTKPGSIVRNQVGQAASQIPPLAPEVL